MGTTSLPIVLIGFTAYMFIENITRVLQSDYLNSIAKSSNRATFLSANSLIQNSFSSTSTVMIGHIGQSSLFAAFALISLTKLIALLLLGTNSSIKQIFKQISST